MKTYAVVIAIVKYRKKILLLKRNSNRRSSPDKWQPVSGFIQEKESLEDSVIREVKEETNLKGKIIKSGEVFEVQDKWGRWIIVPFLIKVNSDKVKIDPDEHSEYTWVTPQNINKFNCVRGTKKDLKAVGLL